MFPFSRKKLNFEVPKKYRFEILINMLKHLDECDRDKYFEKYLVVAGKNAFDIFELSMKVQHFFINGSKNI